MKGGSSVNGFLPLLILLAVSASLCCTLAVAPGQAGDQHQNIKSEPKVSGTDEEYLSEGSAVGECASSGPAPGPSTSLSDGEANTDLAQPIAVSNPDSRQHPSKQAENLLASQGSITDAAVTDEVPPGTVPPIDATSSPSATDSLLQQLLEARKELDAVRQQLNQAQQQLAAARSSLQVQEVRVNQLMVAWQGHGIPTGKATLGLPQPPLAFERMGGLPEAGSRRMEAAAPVSSSLGAGEYTWSNSIRLLTAVRADANVTSLHFMSGVGTTGNARFLVLGDALGKMYVFNTRGLLMQEYDTGSHSAVTSMTSFFARKHEIVIVTGHESGEVRMHDTREESRLDGADVALGAIRLRSVTPATAGQELTVVQDQAPVGQPGGRNGSDYGSASLPQTEAAQDASGGGVDPGSMRVLPPRAASPITHLLPFKQGSRTSGRKMVLAVDQAGWARAVRDSGEVRWQGDTHHQQLAMQQAGSSIVMLSATHATTLNVALNRKPRSFECQHLNGSAMVAVAFDAARAFRGYAVGGRGELLSLIVPHESRTTVCKVIKSRPLVIPPGPVSLASYRGYLLLSHPMGHTIVNVTNPSKSGPQDVLFESTANLGEPLGLMPNPGEGPEGAHPPVVGCSRATMLALHLGGGVVVLYESLLFQPSPNELGKIWAQPLFVVAMLLVGVWQFYRQRSRSQAKEYDMMYSRDVMAQFGAQRSSRLGSNRRQPMAMGGSPY